MSVHPLQRKEPLVLSAPGGRAFETIRPRAALPPESKRVERVIKNEHDLAGQLGELELSTRERNKAFEEQLQAIEERAKNFQIKLSAERCAMEEQNKAIMTSLQQRLDAVTKSIEASVEDKISQQYLAPLEVETQRLVAEEAKVEDFILNVVPRIREDQYGSITKQLQRAYETFDIEKAKIAKREHKILNRFQAHVGKTAQEFEEEEATRLSKLRLLGEDIDETERMDDRAAEPLEIKLVQQIKAARQSIAEMSKEREHQDCLTLDSMIAAQEKLQSCIINTFGTGSLSEGKEDR